MKEGFVFFLWFVFLCFVGYTAYETVSVFSEIGFLIFFWVLWLLAALATPGNGTMDEWYALPLWYFMMYGSIVGVVTMIIRLGMRAFS